MATIASPTVIENYKIMIVYLSAIHMSFKLWESIGNEVTRLVAESDMDYISNKVRIFMSIFTTEVFTAEPLFGGT